MVSDQKIYYTPSSFNVSLNISDTDQKSKLRSETETTRKQNVNSTRKINMGYRLLQSINFMLEGLKKLT